ncbi:MAG: glycosyltransferase family 39 protein [Chloroflexi bacterium]|nr:glycosyltransferase family 39 protein [Chloroflexota bacterium]
MNKSHNRALVAILIAALTLRLGWILWIDPNPTLEGGDGTYYLSLGRSVSRGEPAPGWANVVGPVYPIYLSLFYRFVPEAGVVQAARIGQAILDMLTCLATFDLARRIFDANVGLLAAASLAIDLRFIVQAAAINTETLFIFLLVLGVLMFAAARSWARYRIAGYAASSAILFVTALTRPIILPLPLLLLATLLLPKPTRAQLIAVGLAVAAGIAAIAAHTTYHYQRTGLIIVINDGLAANFWMGSRGDGQWHGIIEFEKQRDEMAAKYGTRYAYIEDALDTIANDPLAYVRLLFRKLSAAYLQPHGTVSFPGESLKEMAAKVLRGEMSVNELLRADSFWPKLCIYILHSLSVIGGLAGLWLARREWVKILPLALPLFWISFAYTLLTIIPRYVFPTMPFYTACAAYALMAGRERLFPNPKGLKDL